MDGKKVGGRAESRFKDCLQHSTKQITGIQFSTIYFPFDTNRQRDVNPDNFTTSSSSSLSLSSSGARRQTQQKYSPNFSPEYEEDYEEESRQMPKYCPNFSPEYQENEGGGRRRRLSLMPPPAPVAPSSIRDSDNTSIIKQKINSKPLHGDEYEEYLTTKKVTKNNVNILF